MATFDLSTIGPAGLYGSALVAFGYALARAAVGIADRLVFLLGLRMILRGTRGSTRETVLLAYIDRRRSDHRLPGGRSAGAKLRIAEVPAPQQSRRRSGRAGS